MMRLDVFLAESGLSKSRSEAKSMIEAGNVSVAGKVVTKPAFEIDCREEEISVDRSGYEFVSRGGNKLKAALDSFKIDVFDKICLDVGASSGGFTDCLLKHGAKSVFALDSGTMQLVDALRLDPRVTVMENFNARYMAPENFSSVPELAVMDVSFISATYIIPSVYEVLSPVGDFICLIKPQFEVGKRGLSKGGVVKDTGLREEAVKKVVSFAVEKGFHHFGTIVSPIKGGDGNTEYLAYFAKR